MVEDLKDDFSCGKKELEKINKEFEKIKEKYKNSKDHTFKQIEENIKTINQDYKKINFNNPEIENNKTPTQREKLKNINEELINMLNSNNIDEKELKLKQNEFYGSLNEKSDEDNSKLANEILNNIEKINQKIKNNNSLKENNSLEECFKYYEECKKIIKELEQYNSIFEEYIEKVCSKNFDENLYENNKKLFYNREKEFTIFVNENINKNQIENDKIDEMKTKIFDNISISKNINKNIDNELQNNLNNINNKTSKNIKPFLFYCETMFKKYIEIFEKNSTDSEKILKSLGDNLNKYENLKDTLNNLNKIENEFMSTRFKYHLLKNKENEKPTKK